jgi:TRAP-type mannitol/chloroaromatic compound transport system permease large subunit
VLPLLGPIVSSLGFEINGYGKVETPELVWFVVIIAVCLQTSFLTPPVGFSLFFLAGVAPKGTELIEIYKGVIPFIIIQLIGLALVICGRSW